MDIETSSNECLRILRKLKNYLEKHRLKEIEELMDDKIWTEIDDDLESKWDLITLISSRLKTLNKYRFKTFEMCQNLLIEIANRCNPKEMLLAFLTELENGVNDQDANESDSSNDDIQTTVSNSSEQYNLSSSSFDNCVKSFFTPLRIMINRIPNQKENNLKWVLDTLNGYLLKIDPPNQTKSIDKSTNDRSMNDKTNGSIKQSNEFNELNQMTPSERFDYLLPDYLNFLSEFVDQYTNDKYKSISAKHLNGKLILIKTLLSLLHHPLMYLDLSKPNQIIDKCLTNKLDKEIDKDIIGLTNTKYNLLSELKGIKCFEHNSQLYSFQIVNLITRLEPNIFELYSIEQLICRADDNSSFKLTENVIKYSFGVQAYIVFVLLDENSKFLPSTIYSPIYTFQCHLPFSICLIEHREPLVCLKGINLIEKLIFKVADQSLKSSFLDYLREHSLDRSLIKVMRFSSNEQLRRKSFSIYKKLINSFDNKGRYDFIYKTCAYPNQYGGIRGLMITIYKDFIMIEDQNNEFIGSNLQNFMRLIIDQMNLVQEEFDLIENMDTLMSFLNLIRFLLIWDKKTINQTGVFNHLNLIHDFTDKLKKKIEFGRNFLKMKINTAKIEKKKPKKKELLIDISCANDDDDLTDLFNNLSEKDEIKMYRQGLVNVDMMDSVLARVNELITKL